MTDNQRTLVLAALGFCVALLALPAIGLIGSSPRYWPIGFAAVAFIAVAMLIRRELSRHANQEAPELDDQSQCPPPPPLPRNPNMPDPIDKLNTMIGSSEDQLIAGFIDLLQGATNDPAYVVQAARDVHELIIAPQAREKFDIYATAEAIVRAMREGDEAERAEVFGIVVMMLTLMQPVTGRIITAMAQRHRDAGGA